MFHVKPKKIEIIIVQTPTNITLEIIEETVVEITLTAKTV